MFLARFDGLYHPVSLLSLPQQSAEPKNLWKGTRPSEQELDKAPALDQIEVPLEERKDDLALGGLERQECLLQSC